MTKKPLLCRIGLHDKVGSTKFEPSIDAELITAFGMEIRCRRCGKVFLSARDVWNGEEFVKDPNHKAAT